MTTWKDILLDTIRLTDEVKRLNALTEKLSDKAMDLDKRIFRLETLIEIAKYQTSQKKLDSE